MRGQVWNDIANIRKTSACRGGKRIDKQMHHAVGVIRPTAACTALGCHLKAGIDLGDESKSCKRRARLPKKTHIRFLGATSQSSNAVCRIPTMASEGCTVSSDVRIWMSVRTTLLTRTRDDCRTGSRPRFRLGPARKILWKIRSIMSIYRFLDRRNHRNRPPLG